VSRKCLSEREEGEGLDDREKRKRKLYPPKKGRAAALQKGRGGQEAPGGCIVIKGTRGTERIAPAAKKPKRGEGGPEEQAEEGGKRTTAKGKGEKETPAPIRAEAALTCCSIRKIS